MRIYRSHLRGFIEWIRLQEPDIDSLTRLRRVPHIENWLRYLAEHRPRYAWETLRQRIITIRRFLEYLVEWEWPEAPPPGLIFPSDLPHTEHYLPRPLAPEADRSLREGLKARGDLYALALLLQRSTGVRIGELRRLEVDCLSRSEHGWFSLRVPLGKLHTERIIPIDDDTAQLVEPLRALRGNTPPWHDPQADRFVELLLRGPKGGAVDKYRLASTLKAVARSVGIQERVHTHRLRHTYATELLRHGMSLPGIMKLLGLLRCTPRRPSRCTGTVSRAPGEVAERNVPGTPGGIR